jgi:hypothetical protein
LPDDVTVRNIGATIKNIEPTSAEIELTGKLTREAIIQAIEKAGYKVSN